jgi:hypothetical protein
VNASTSHAKRTICVLEFIPHTFTAMAHAEELGEIAGVQENFYEEKSRLITSGSFGTFLSTALPSWLSADTYPRSHSY